MPIVTQKPLMWF